MTDGPIRLSEVFDSFQGEGVWSGVYQLFVRLSGCTVGCQYCDTPYAHVAEPQTKLRIGATQRAVPNNWTADSAAAEVALALAAIPPVHSISFTGGEPLEHPVSVAALASAFRAGGIGVDFWLETAGLHPDELRTVGHHFRYLSLDMKLSAILPPLSPERWQRVCDETAAWQALGGPRDAQVKIVLTPDIDPARFDAFVALTRRVLPLIPLVLQPARGNYRKFDPAVRDSFQTWYRRAAVLGGPVRLAPQWQHLIGIP